MALFYRANGTFTIAADTMRVDVQRITVQKISKSVSHDATMPWRSKEEIYMTAYQTRWLRT